MEQVTQWLNDVLDLTNVTQRKIFISIALVILLTIVRFLFIRFLNRRTEDVRVRYRWRKTTAYVITLVGILIIGRIWLEGIQSLATFLGLLSAGLAIALRDFIANMAGWAFILWRRPFRVGDRIQVGTYAGDVIDVRIFKFTLLEINNWVKADQSTGRIIDVPNSMVITDIVGNYSMGFPQIWNEIPVLVTFESNWEKAKKILQDIANKNAEHLTSAAERKIKEAAKQFMIFYTKLTPIVYTSVQDSGVLLTIRYLCEIRNRRSSEENMWEDILREFKKCDDVDFAYPTRRFYDNKTEGKKGAGGIK